MSDQANLLDLNKIKAFNETLFGDLFWNDVSLSFVKANKNYLIVPLKLSARGQSELSYEVDF
jgi:hypothetical protein